MNAYDKDLSSGMPVTLADQRADDRRQKRRLTVWVVPQIKAKKAKKSKKVANRAVPATNKEKARVIKLQSGGMSYRKIESELGWNDCSGARAFRIVQLAK